MAHASADVRLRSCALSPLPLGSIRPSGWIERQLRIQADGLTGHLDEFWPDVAQSGWIGGDAEGWERAPYWLDGLVPLAFQLDDDRLKTKVHRWVDYILDHQHEDGWLGSRFDKRVTDPRDLRPGRPSHSYEHDPWPRFVLLKALRQYQEATGDERVIPAMERFLHKLDDVTDTQYLRSWGRYRWSDLVVSIHWLYERTGEAWLLRLAEKMHDQGFDWVSHFERFPYRDRCLREERDLTTHVVNNAMAIKAGGVWYRQSDDQRDRDAAALAIRELDTYHGQANGVFSGDEHLAGRNPSQGTELCAVVEYMYSLEVLISILGEGWLADRLERIAFNALPATISPDMWTHQYVQQVNQAICRVDEDRIYTSNGPDANIFGLEPNFGCCTADMHQGWPKFVSHLWMATPDDGLAAIGYAPCSLVTTIEGKPVRVAVSTDYPFNGDVEISVSVDAPTRFPIHLRIPEWATSARIRIDDGDEIGPEAGTFHRMDREWSEVSVIRLSLPMPVRYERRDGMSVSIYRGPLLLALPVGEDWRKVGGEDPHADWEIHPTTPWNYAIRMDDPKSIHIETKPIGWVPFSPEDPPVIVAVTGQRVPGWGLEHNAAAPVPESPLKSEEPLDDLKLVPYGSTNLRIAQFPTTGGSAERTAVQEVRTREDVS